MLDRPEASAPLIVLTPPLPRTKSKVVSFVAVLLAAAAIYAVPWMGTLARNRSGLPAIFGADFYAYLNLSHVFTFAGVADHDPWYGVPIQPKFGHSTFRAAFAFFAAARSLLGNDVITSTTCSICWSTLIACSLWLLLRALFEERSAIFLFAGTSLMVFFSLSTLKINIIDWLHFLAATIRTDLPLPFIRMFFPQIAIPLLASYFLCCKKALGSWPNEGLCFPVLNSDRHFCVVPVWLRLHGPGHAHFPVADRNKERIAKTGASVWHFRCRRSAC